MPTQVQFRRGTTAQNDSFTGAEGEITIDTDVDTIRVHDGTTQGGWALTTLSKAQTLANKTFSGTTVFSGNQSAAQWTINGVGIKVSPATYTDTSSSGTVAQEAAHGIGSPTFAFTNGTTLTAATTLYVAEPTAGTNATFTQKYGLYTGNISVSGIFNNNANGVGNIGTSTTYFNTIFAKATSAQYADLAEKYIADMAYPAGTVLDIGGTAEVTISTSFASPRVCGVVSTHPAFIMNSGENSPNTVEVALTGRIPCRVVGKIKRGDLLCTSDIPGVATSLNPTQYVPGSIIGKSLANYDSDEPGIIEILVGRQ